jgi:hypothetical protein
MIPKIIHYCWFGGNPLPDDAKKCIETWRKFLPDYEIKEWNESNFDVNIIPFVSEAYQAKKFAFVSDYARFWILYKYGGLYFDTDVEIIKNMDHIISKGPFMGCQYESKPGEDPMNLGVNPGVGLGVTPKHIFYKTMLDKYQNMHFVRQDGSVGSPTVVVYTTEELCKQGLNNLPDVQCIAGIYIYPVDYFNPKSYETGKITLTNNTVSIHQFAASWISGSARIKLTVQHLIGLNTFRKLAKIKKAIFNR